MADDTQAIESTEAAEGEKAHHHVVGEKCDMCGMDSWPGFAGGALTFAALDEYRQAQEVQEAVSEAWTDFDLIFSNIRNSSDLDSGQKADAIIAAAQELPGRMAQSRADAEAEGQAEGMRGADATTTDFGSLTAFKDLTGRWRWVAIHSNKYEDREGEIFSEDAHKAFVAEVNRTKAFPTLRLWHIPWDIGVSDMVDYADGFVISSGTFGSASDPMDDIAENLSQMKDLGCSHGYIYRNGDLRDGVYHAYRSNEISVLPRERAANTLTAYFAGQEVPMPLTPQAKAFLEQTAGPDRTRAIEDGLASLKDFADANGLSYKSIEDGLLQQRAKDDEAAEDPDEEEATAAGEGDPGEGEGEAGENEPEEPTEEEREEAEEAKAAAAPLEAHKELLAGIKEMFGEAIAPLTAEMDGIKERLDELERSDGEKIADQIRPRIGPNARGKASSQSDDNVVSEEEAAKAKTEEQGEKDGDPVGPFIQDLRKLSGAGIGGNGFSGN